MNVVLVLSIRFVISPHLERRAGPRFFALRVISPKL